MAYQEKFPAGSRVRIAELKELARFQADWRYHHPLQPEQLEHAGETTNVREVSFYHGGDVLYVLENIPGIWHEQCLSAA